MPPTAARQEPVSPLAYRPMPDPTPTVRVLIVDDAAQARRLLRLMLAEHLPQAEVVAEAASVDEATAHIRNLRPDVVLLDIEMPHRSGLDLVETISREEVPYEIIFTTAYNNYAIRAFRLSAIDYLLKPIQEEELVQAMTKVIRQKAEQQQAQRLQLLVQNLRSDKDPVVSIPVLNGYEYIRLSDVCYLKADGSYTHIHLVNGKNSIVSRNLKYFETLFESTDFLVRVHRGYIINLFQMKRFERTDRGLIVMQDGYEIDLARDRRELFLQRLAAFAL